MKIKGTLLLLVSTLVLSSYAATTTKTTQQSAAQAAALAEELKIDACRRAYSACQSKCPTKVNTQWISCLNSCGSAMTRCQQQPTIQ